MKRCIVCNAVLEEHRSKFCSFSCWKKHEQKKKMAGKPNCVRCGRKIEKYQKEYYIKCAGRLKFVKSLTWKFDKRLFERAHRGRGS